MERYFWTNKEVALVKAHYPAGGVQACLHLLPGRTKSGIYKQTIKLGLYYKDKAPHPKKLYETSDEIDRMITNAYQTQTEKGAIKKLAKRISRPYWLVKKRTSPLGVSQPVLPDNKEPDCSIAEVELLEANFHKSPYVIARIFIANGFSRTATAITVKRKRMQFDTVDIDHYTACQLAR